jgi:hypothetical protein
VLDTVGCAATSEVVSTAGADLSTQQARLGRANIREYCEHVEEQCCRWSLMQ